MITYKVEVYPSGEKCWYLNGKLHREDGPAVEWADGSKYWFLNGQLHREDGPAVEWSDGTKHWYLNGQYYIESEYKQKLTPAKEMTVAEISKALGFDVKIVKE